MTATAHAQDAAQVSGATTSLSLDRHRELSHPHKVGGDSDRCTCAHRVWLRSDLGELVKARGRCVNQCDYCGQLQAAENTEMLSLDAAEGGNAPDVWCVLTTRTATVDMADFYKARELLVRAFRRRWPELQYACLLEYTTGYGARSGGERRPHWNLLLKAVGKGDIPELQTLIAQVWCGNVDAEPAAQHVGTVYSKGGLMKYLAKHFAKSSQRPPAEFRGQRFNCSRGYFGELTRAQARSRAVSSLRLKRELSRAQRAGLQGARALERAQACHRERCRRVWVMTNAHGARIGPQGLDPRRMVLPTDRRELFRGMPQGAALQRANDIRIRQSELKRDLRRGVMPLAAALEDPHLQRMRVYDLLCCLPMRGGGTDRGTPRRASPLADDLFERLDVAPLVRLQDLTERQRSFLAGLYRDRFS